MEERIRAALEQLFDAEVAQQARLENLGGHASLRIYWRVHLPEGHWPRGEHTRMAMVLPDEANPLKSEEAESTDAAAPTELPFIDVHRLLEHMHLPVPAIDLVDMELGVLLLEDLGDRLFEHLYLDIVRDFGPDQGDLRLPTEQLYHRAINLLVEVQRAWRQTQYAHTADPPSSIAFERSFDRGLLRWELDHYREWGLQAQYGEDVLQDADAELTQWFDRLVEDLLELHPALVLRDFQSRNIMQKHGKFYLIDFQDALMGPFVYDLVALLRDSYIELPYVTVHRLVDYYTSQGAAAGLTWCDDPEVVQRAFNLQTVQRKLKDAGRFVYIDRVKGNPDFLPYYRPSIGYVRQALEMLPEYEGLADIIAEFEPAWHHE